MKTYTALAAALLLIVPAAGAASSYQAILEAEEAGEITVEEAALYLTYSVLAPDRLPAGFVGMETEPCGTPALHEAYLMLEEVSAPIRNEILSLANRPDYSPYPEYTFDSDGGYFKIHWTDEGPWATDLAYCQEIADAADLSWETEVDEMGYYAPPSDLGLGGDTNYDIYVKECGGTTLGYTTCSGEPSNPETPGGKASHIAMDRNIYSDGTKVCTVSHEFQHACQMAADAAEPTWFMENCAVWMEEQVYPEIDDYQMYCGGKNPLTRPMWDIRTSPGDLYHYGAFTWPWYMENSIDVEAVLEVWIKCAEEAGNNMLEAQTDMFADYGKTFEEAFMEYGHYRWCTADQWYDGCGLYDEEASEWYPGPLVISTYHYFDELPAYDIEDMVGVAGDTYELECFGLHWIQVELANYQDGWVTFDFNGRDNFDWNVSLIMFNDAGGSYYQWFDVEQPNNEISVAAEASGWDYVIFSPVSMFDSGLDMIYEADITYSTNAEGGVVTPQQLDLGVSSNPLTTAGAVSVDLPTAARAELTVYDMTGRRVATLCNEELAAGSHNFGLQDLNLDAGTYLFRLVSGRQIATQKVVLVP